MSLIYPWLKALHIAAVMLWLAGMVLSAHILAPAGSDAAARNRLLSRVHRWDLRVTTPAMAAAWVIGLTMAYEAGWFGQAWLWAKLALVVLLSALHGILSGSLRRQAADPGHRLPAATRFALPAILAAVLAVVCLAVVKPF